MINNRTLRDLLLPKKEHKETEDSQKINYAMKTIIRIINRKFSAFILVILSCKKTLK